MRARTEQSPAILLVALWACAVILRFESAVSGDTWFCLFFGRDILEHGLPHTNDVTVVAAGTWWIDAQWLAHVTWNRLFAAGGFPLCMVLEGFLEGLGLAIAAHAARNTGASSMRVAILGAGHGAAADGCGMFGHKLSQALGQGGVAGVKGEVSQHGRGEVFHVFHLGLLASFNAGHLAFGVTFGGPLCFQF